MARLLFIVAVVALAASAPCALAIDYPQRPKCTPAGTQQFIDNLYAASNNCSAVKTYDWDGNDDPTSAQRIAICNCTVAPFDIPKCSWMKAVVYNVSVNEHFHYVYKCDVINGKQAPEVTEVEADVGTVAPTVAPTIAPANTSSSSTAAPAAVSDLCTATQISAFTTTIKTASSCLASTTYDWSGPTNPTNAQYADICKCPSVSDVAIPVCSVMKGSDRVTLSEHYNWVLKTQCPQFATTTTASKKSSNSVGMIGGIAGVVVVAALLVVFFVWKRKRSNSSKTYESNDMLSPRAYQSMEGTPQYTKNFGASGISTVETNVSTGNGGMRQSGNRTDSISRFTESSKWDDPVIQAVRVPYDSILVGSLLSRGGFGEVRKGTYRGETVAIKSLLPDRRKDLVQIETFLAEIKLVASLEHERIVKFIGVAWNSLSDACMVVEYMENGDLRSVLTRWDSGPEQRPSGFDVDKVKIALHVAHALVYLHSLQPVVLHRDLKSKNVLLDANFDAKLTDFGTSRERVDKTMTAGVGSSLWMAPEILMGERYDEKADVFSFGVVLSELDTHQLPYYHAKVSDSGQKLPEAAILQQVMLGRLSVLFTDRVHPELVLLGRDCISLNPKNRPTTAEVLHRVHQVMRDYR